MKFCKDCKFSNANITQHEFGPSTYQWLCEKKPHSIDLVDRVKLWWFCSVARTNKELCGPEGKWFIKAK